MTARPFRCYSHHVQERGSWRWIYNIGFSLVLLGTSMVGAGLIMAGLSSPTPITTRHAVLILDGNDCLHWCAIDENGVYDAWATEAQMNAALPTLPYVPVYSGPDSGPTFSYWWAFWNGLTPRLLTNIICGGAEGFVVYLTSAEVSP
jgi:hypothetical protein